MRNRARYSGSSTDALLAQWTLRQRDRGACTLHAPAMKTAGESSARLFSLPVLSYSCRFPECGVRTQMDQCRGGTCRRRMEDVPAARRAFPPQGWDSWSVFLGPLALIILDDLRAL